MLVSVYLNEILSGKNKMVIDDFLGNFTAHSSRPSNGILTLFKVFCF